MKDYRLLGPLEVVDDGKPLELPRGKPRALLARLLLNAGEVVSTEELADSIWGDEPPRSAHKILHVYVSQLRKALGHEAIETRPPGYRLRADHASIDLGRFERLLQAAREEAEAERRSELAARALAIWRGAALAEFRREPFAGPGARRLAELRLSALEQRIEADLELGRHAELVPELEALVGQEPLRERPRQQLMLALYRCGRQAEALECFRQARRLLAGELGIEPGRSLQELQRAILRHDPDLDRASRRESARRGCVIAVGSSLHELLGPLCADGRELLLLEIPTEAAALPERTAALANLRETLIGKGLEARTACFTSRDRAADILRLAAEEDAELLVLDDLPPAHVRAVLTSLAGCDVAFAPRPELTFAPHAPIVVPFAGDREEWSALELAAWLARTYELPLQLLGSEARGARRDASRMLASASLALQRFAAAAAEPVVVPPGADAILAQPASLVVLSLPSGELDPTRTTLIERTRSPLLFVHGGLRPGGLAPERTLTRFSWSLAGAGA